MKQVNSQYKEMINNLIILFDQEETFAWYV